MALALDVRFRGHDENLRSHTRTFAIGRLLLSCLVPGRAVRKAVVEAQLLASDDTMNELADVLARAKLDA